MRGIFLIIITLTGLFFYSYRLKETQLFRDDTARDTLRALRIWQNKELTLIGPPISFTQQTTREVYLGSLFLYIGLVGLLLANWDPIGAVLPNIFFFTLSIPFFYLLVSRLTDSFWKKVAAIILYTLSPITVTHARFFWNPNLIIPVTVFFWYLVFRKNKSQKANFLNPFLAGIIAGIMFNLHYLAVIPLVIYIFTLLIAKQISRGVSILVGLIIGSLPIIIFEIKNNFYLTESLYLNLVQGRGPGSINLLATINYLFNIFWSILGLRQSEIDFPTPFISGILNDPLLYVATLTVLVIAIFRKNNNSHIDRAFWPMMLSAILLTVYFSSGHPVRLRYLFSIYPILLWVIVEFIFRIGSFFAGALLFIPIIITSVMIITQQLNLQKNFIQLSLIEDICKEIVKDNPAGSYNITENLKGDARAMSFRYCVTKDAKVKPYDELSYYNLTSLYVISPSFDKIYKDNRWEFYASAPWDFVKSTDFGEVKLFKFVK